MKKVIILLSLTILILLVSVGVALGSQCGPTPGQAPLNLNECVGKKGNQEYDKGDKRDSEKCKDEMAQCESIVEPAAKAACKAKPPPKYQSSIPKNQGIANAFQRDALGGGMTQLAGSQCGKDSSHCATAGASVGAGLFAAHGSKGCFSNEAAQELSCSVASFAKGTLVTTSRGNVPIEDITTSDLVLSYNLFTGEQEYAKVAQVRHPTPANEYYIINNIKVTRFHKFYTDGYWTKASSIKVGDLLLNKNGQKVPVEYVEKVVEDVEVYDLTVEKTKTYYVQNILVHNSKGDASAGPEGGGGGAPSLGDVGSLLSGIGSIMSGVAALQQAETAEKQLALQREQFEFDKFKYFEDQRRQNAVCDPTGVVQGGTNPNCEEQAPTQGGAGDNLVGFGSSEQVLCSPPGQICQDTSKLPSATNIVFASIHMTFPSSRNYFALLEGKNDGIRYSNPVVSLDDGGVTKMSINPQFGQFIEDKNNNLVWLMGGTTTYYANEDRYLTNSHIWHPQSGMLTVTTSAFDGDEFGFGGGGPITGGAVHAPQGFTTSITYDHFALSGHPNAVDISSNGENFNVLTKGYSNHAIFAGGLNFPFVSRNVLKGDTAIVSNRNAQILAGYVARDHTYSYLIFPQDGVTKVSAQGSKIIQESGGMPRALSSREAVLLYGEGRVPETVKQNLIFD